MRAASRRWTLSEGPPLQVRVERLDDGWTIWWDGRRVVWPDERGPLALDLPVLGAGRWRVARLTLGRVPE